MGYEYFLEKQYVSPHILKINQFVAVISYFEFCLNNSNFLVEFVVGSPPNCSEGFLQVLQFSSLHKNEHAKFQLGPDAHVFKMGS